MRSNIICIILLLILQSCTKSPVGRQAWYISIDSVVNDNSSLIYQYPDSLRVILSRLPIASDDSMAQNYRLVQYARCFFFCNQADYALACLNNVEHFTKNAAPSASLNTLKALKDNMYGVFLQSKNERDSALTYIRQAYIEICNADMRHELPNICINAADICRQSGKLPQAAYWYRTAMLATDSLHMDELKHSIQTGLGQIYADLNNFDLAQKYFTTAESTYPPQTHYEKYFFYNSRGNAYYFEGKHKEALTCFRKAYKEVQTFKQPFNNAIVEANMGEIFMLLGQNDSAHHYIDMANHYFSNSSQTDDAIRFYINGLYAALALQENDLHTAHRYLAQTYDMKQIGPSYLYLYNKRLMEYYAKSKDYTQAYHYQQLVKQYDDSLRNVRYLNNISEIDYRYQQDTTLLHRDITIARTQSHVSRLRSIITLVISILILIIISYSSLYFYMRRRNERKRQEQLKLITHLRMENVRNRFSPHFVFNVLNAVIGSLSAEESRALPLHMLIKVLRSNLLDSDKIAIQLNDEIELVKNYADLRRSTNPQTPQVVWNICQNVDLTQLLPSMIIQIPVENAIKHAFPAEYQIEETPLIQINICNTDNGCIMITIEDNGIGYIPSARPVSKLNTKDTGTGIRILYRTVELLNMKNSNKMKFEIVNRSVSQSDQHGTRVNILIPNSFKYNL